MNSQRYNPRVFTYQSRDQSDCPYNDTDENGDLIDPLSFEPFNSDQEIVMLSSGHCYSYNTLNDWINMNNISNEGRPIDPRSNTQMTEGDMRLFIRREDIIIDSEPYLYIFIDSIKNIDNRTVKRLLQLGFDPNTGAGVILLTAVNNGGLVILHKILKAGADPNLPNGEPLFTTIWNSSIHKTNELVKYGADVNYNNGEPLLMAIQRSIPAIVRILLENDADVNIRHGEPLRTAVLKKRVQVVSDLLKHGADPNLPNYDPLIIASQLGQTEIVDLLLYHGARPVAEALQMASKKGFLEVVKLLISAGADPLANDMNAYHLALEYGQQHIVDYIVDRLVD